MADRHTTQARQGAGGNIPRSRNGTSNVRRNLFQSQLTRRPTPSSSTSDETLRLDNDGPSESSDIVVRDKNGDIEMGDPPTPTFDDPDEVALDAAQENESKWLAAAQDSEQQETNGMGLEERQRLADAVKHHQIDQNSIPAQPEGSWQPKPDSVAPD